MYSLTPYLVCKGAARAIDFYKKAFGAQEIVRMPGPNGQVMHAEVKIGNSMLMLSDENPERGNLSPQSIGGTATSIMFTATMWMRCSIAPCRSVPPPKWRPPTSSGAIEWATSSIRLATSGP